MPAVSPRRIANGTAARGERPFGRKVHFQLVRVVRKLSYRALARGDKATAVRVTSHAVRQFPQYPFAVRLHAHALLAPPVASAEADRALAALEPVLGSEPLCRSAFVDALHTKARLAASAAEVANRLRPLVLLPDGTGLGAARQFLEEEHTWGRDEVLTAAVDELLACREAIDPGSEGPLAGLIHDVALLTGDLGLATGVAAVVGTWPGVDDELRAHMAAALSLAEGRPHEALRTLESLPPQRSAAYSKQVMASHLALGRHELVLDYLATIRHGIPDNEALVLRYDALHALGRLDEADALAATIRPSQLAHAGMFRVLRDYCERHPRQGSAQLEEAVRTFESGAVLSPQNVAALTGMYFHLGRLDDVDRVHHDAIRRGGSLLGPSARLVVAKALYARRRFDEAIRMLDAMRGVGNRWDAEKLRARILLERGDFDGAVAHRTRFRDAGNDLDEVLYHALVQQRRFGEAFAVYLPPRDRRRLVAVFGNRAEFGPDFPLVRRRLVVSQAGPGDELAIASTYASLRATCDELFVTCDPRLATLLSRSYPEIGFFPVERLRAHQPGALAPGREPRAGNVLYDLLTDRAMSVAADCDAVVLGRSLVQLTIGTNPGPYDSYLQPRADLAQRLGARLQNGSRRVGVVWRSELRGPMRDIHYLGVDDLRPLLARSDQFVCLQHDATPAERAALNAMASSPVEFRDDIDLRNDFESTAALVAGLDVVVGIGTAVLELSAAVGTPVIMLQPTHFGTWRAMDAEGSDFWHRSMRVVVLDEPWRRDRLVESACRMLDRVNTTVPLVAF